MRPATWCRSGAWVLNVEIRLRHRTVSANYARERTRPGPLRRSGPTIGCRSPIYAIARPVSRGVVAVLPVKRDLFSLCGFAEQDGLAKILADPSQKQPVCGMDLQHFLCQNKGVIP